MMADSRRLRTPISEREPWALSVFSARLLLPLPLMLLIRGGIVSSQAELTSGKALACPCIIGGVEFPEGTTGTYFEKMAWNGTLTTAGTVNVAGTSWPAHTSFSWNHDKIKEIVPSSAVVWRQLSIPAGSGLHIDGDQYKRVRTERTTSAYGVTWPSDTTFIFANEPEVHTALPVAFGGYTWPPGAFSVLDNKVYQFEARDDFTFQGQRLAATSAISFVEGRPAVLCLRQPHRLWDQVYPGDSCVDVVSRSLLMTAAPSNKSSFNELTVAAADFPQGSIASVDQSLTGDLLEWNKGRLDGLALQKGDTIHPNSINPLMISLNSPRTFDFKIISGSYSLAHHRLVWATLGEPVALAGTTWLPGTSLAFGARDGAVLRARTVPGQMVGTATYPEPRLLYLDGDAKITKVVAADDPSFYWESAPPPTDVPEL